MERVREGCRDCAGELAQSCLGYVVRTAREFRGYGVPLEDLVNEGNVGLLEAARRFDAGRGTRFLTYARWWIRKAILQALDEQARVVRVPSYQIRKSRENRALESALARHVGRAAGVAEISERHGALKHREISLDERPHGGDRNALAEILRDERGSDPERSLIHKQSLCVIQDAWVLLTERQRKVLSRRFGLTGEPILSLKAIGRTMDLSHERVRQIEMEAIARIRRACDAAGRRRPAGGRRASRKG